MSSSEPIGTIRTLWRFPVKSMLGEDLDAVDLSEGGVIGDRAYAVRDRETGKVASAKYPKLWPNLFACQAAFVEPPRAGGELPPARIELGDGTSVMSDAADVDAVLSRFFGRDVELARAAQNGYTIDQYHPDEENYDPEGHRDEVVEVGLAANDLFGKGFPVLLPATRPFANLYRDGVIDALWGKESAAAYRGSDEIENAGWCCGVCRSGRGWRRFELVRPAGRESVVLCGGCRARFGDDPPVGRGALAPVRTRSRDG